MDDKRLILTVNGGSSSIKFALYTAAAPQQRRLIGQIERIGQSGTQLSYTTDPSSPPQTRPIEAGDYRQAARNLVAFLRQPLGDSTIVGVGHRVVHGGVHLVDHQPVTPELIAELRRTQPLDLAHLPREIALIEGMRESFPGVRQIACFDTAFHRDMPRVATLLPIPRRYYDAGIRRLGFHGLSFTYLMSRLDPAAVKGRVILAHLGSGASMAAVLGGKPMDTTMAFTPTAGLVMGTRSGDIDPGLLVYMLRVEKLTPEQMDEFVSHKCGMIGIAETTYDMRDLLQRRATDLRAADAIDVFCYQARRHLAALTASLGGLDTLVFAGGIGEHVPEVRAAICHGLDYLGLSIDASRNSSNSEIISAPNSRVTVRVIATDEEVVIARAVGAFLQTGKV